MKKMKNVVAIALCLCMVAFPASVFAESSVVNGTDENGLPQVTTTTTETATDENGNTVVTVTIQKDTEGTNADGAEVKREETRVETTVTDENGSTVSSTWTEDGKETVSETSAPQLDVDVPTEAGKNTSTGAEEGSASGEGTVSQQGSVTVETGSVTVTEGVSVETDLEYVLSETEADADNDLVITVGDHAETTDEVPEVADGYGYVYLGSGNSSQFFAALLFKSPSPDFPDEEPIYTDAQGQNYYVRRNHKSLSKNHRVEGIYLDGEMVEDTDFVVGASWSSVQQFLFVDAETGEYLTTYCADQTTPAEYGFSYNMENVEDATYYTDEQAAMIRTVAANGYWGVQDDPETEDPEKGSLAAMKQMMRDAKDENGNPVFTEAEVAALTDGIAMTATQYAIWSFSNAMLDAEFVNAHYIPKDENSESKFANYSYLKNIPEDLQDSVDLIFKLYEHMIAMEPSVPTAKTTANTVINADNFLSELTVTVLDKDEAHANNQDDDTDNDAYITDLSFRLEVLPSTENGDDLVVRVLDADGNELACGRLAGEPGEGENMMVPDVNGNYTFRGISLVEGDHRFNITLEGVQNLEEGVYLFTSEVRDDTSSQTMVGYASGRRGVNVSMDVNFKFTVDDEVVTTVREWHEEGENTTPPGNEEPPETPPRNGFTPPRTPRTEIPEEPVPLVDVPATGDSSWVLLAVAAAAALGIAATFVVRRKQEA